MSLNRVQLIGNLGADPEVRSVGDNTVCDIRVATSEKWTKDGEQKERTEWHRVTVWGKQAEACGKYLSKGRSVYVDGQLRTRKWEDKEGNTRYTTEIVVNGFNGSTVQFLGGGGGKKDQDNAPPAGANDDLPF